MDLDDDSDKEEGSIATKYQNDDREGDNGDDGEISETDNATDYIQNAAQDILSLSSQQC